MENLLLLLIGIIIVLALYKIKYHYSLRNKYLKGISKEDIKIIIQEDKKLAEKQKKFKKLNIFTALLISGISIFILLSKIYKG